MICVSNNNSSIRNAQAALNSAYTPGDGACSIFEVGGSAAGESRLIVPAQGDAFLIDAGFSWSSPQTLENIKACIGNHKLAWVVLSHSHYDHVDGLGYLMQHIPDLKVACAAHTEKVFTRPGALKTMGDLEEVAAHRDGVDSFPKITFPEKADRILSDGDSIQAGNLRFDALYTPGHTRDCLSFWCARERLLFASETTGVFIGRVPSIWTHVPSNVPYVVDMQMLTGYQTTLDAMKRCHGLHPHVLYTSHCPYPLVGDQVEDYFTSAQYWIHLWYTTVKNGMEKGLDDTQILAEHKRFYDNPNMQAVQPEDAFDLNAGYMLRTLKREIAEEENTRR